VKINGLGKTPKNDDFFEADEISMKSEKKKSSKIFFFLKSSNMKSKALVT
jgi:hypothetical protein